MTTPTSDRLVSAVNRMLGRGTGFRSSSFVIPHKPVACPRPKIQRKTGFAYYPKTYTDWRTASEPHVPEVVPQLEGPLVAVVEHVLPLPKTVVRQFPQYDIDNYVKSVFDLITKSERVWRDDEQVVGCWTSKRYVTGDEEPHTRVYIREVGA